IYVGDQERVQEFSPDGTYEGDLPDPGGLLAGETVQSLAVDRESGDLYLSFFREAPNRSKEGVRKLDPAGNSLCTLTAKNPRGIATDATGNVYVIDGVEPEPVVIRQFGPGCTEASSFEDGFDFSTGIAASSGPTCGIEGTDLLVSNAISSNSFVRLYGPPPNPAICPQPVLPPSILDTYATSVDTDGATVKAEINPHFWPDTAYYVQYGTGKCSEGGCEAELPATPGAKLGGGVFDGERTAAVFLPDLSPDTTYHFRFVAQSGGGGPVIGPEESFHTFPPPPEPNTDCPNQAFRTGAGAKLPDCRAYELVSPLEKNNSDVITGRAASFDQASPDGQRVTFTSDRAFADPQAAPLRSQYLAQRDPEDSWSTASISPPRDSVQFYPVGGIAAHQFKAFTEDLCSGWVLQDTALALAPKAPPGVPNLYRRENCGEAGYELLTTTAPPGFGFELEPIDSHYYPDIQGFSADGSRSVFHADAKLTKDACPTAGIAQVYEAFDGGKLRLVSVLPDGKTPACVHSSVGTDQGEPGEFRIDNLHHAVSEDGSRVFWSASEAESKEDPATKTGALNGPHPGKLYLRLNATEAQSKVEAGKCTEAAKACTVVVSEAKDTEFWSADPEGTTAIYTTGDFAAGKGSLFEFDVETTTSQLVATGVKGVMGASEDASRIYFASTDVLTGETQNSEGDEAHAGQPNLYLHEKGSGFTFVAPLSSPDAINAAGDPHSPISILPFKRTSRVSPGGLHAAFMSVAPLTGYDNADVNSGQPAAEVYRFDATANGGAGELHCVSCNPSGARPVGRGLRVFSATEAFRWIAAQIPGWETSLHPSRVLSADGQRLFFNSFDALVLGDTNGRQDVYEWEAPGSGDCTEEAPTFSEPNGGCLSLISSGQSAEDSEFFDASASGSDVFFATQSSLLVQDYGLVDVYDARVNGGFPPPPVPPPACEGEACQGTPSPPDDPTPASAAFEGAGNVAEGRPGRCAKGKVRRRGRCVAKKQRKRAKRAQQRHKRANHNGRAGR
ncbi:MAG TPA: hypothetical protein VNT92_09630, partial [Acidimicrobiia bacterium]|nr:hypothetical protein [Acidimicrobiia bacterium]